MARTGTQLMGRDIRLARAFPRTRRLDPARFRGSSLVPPRLWRSGAFCSRRSFPAHNACVNHARETQRLLRDYERDGSFVDQRATLGQQDPCHAARRSFKSCCRPCPCVALPPLSFASSPACMHAIVPLSSVSAHAIVLVDPCPRKIQL